jgi:type II secretory pathway pseudopilin PulG
MTRLRQIFKCKNEQGFMLPTLLSFIIVAMFLSAAVLEVIQGNFFVVNNNAQRQQAFNIAEAGINYYLWHLSHNPTDFKDGKTTPATQDPNLGYGPYTHNYIDSSLANEGTYTLWVKPQGNGSTIATVRSIGQVKGTNQIRTIQAQIGSPSFSSYAIVSDSELWFGNTETADGPVHSNAGIRLDGANTDAVSSANATYTPDASFGGDGGSHAGVWCSTSVTAPVNCNTRSKSNWIYPAPTVNFNAVSGTLCTMKKVAFSSDASTASLASLANACTQTPTTRTAAYLPQRSTTGSFSVTRGYLVQLNSDGTYDLYQVNSEDDTKSSYSSALGLVSVATAIPTPASGIIFAEDNVWVRSNPTYHGRVTIAAGRLATTNSANLVVADDVVYSTKNGIDAIGLVAENDILIAPYAPPSSGSFTFEVDAAVLTQTGDVVYPLDYRTSGVHTHGWVNASQTFLFYGSVGVRQTWTWSWITGNSGDAVFDAASGRYITGFKNNTTRYDYNLLYAPPPSFPQVSGYNIISWREVLTVP